MSRVLLITGAASGIGWQTCKLFGKNGYAVAFNDYNRQSGEKLLKELQEEGVSAAFYPGDITDEARVGEIVTQCLADFGKYRKDG